MARRREVQFNNNSHRRRPHSSAKTTFQHFFKIILPSIIQNKKMMIPNKFARKFGDELLDVVNFRTPNGSDWKVGLTRDGQEIWFDDGWHDFVKHNSISNGYLLLFGYQGFSNFSVLIFDKSACEVSYVVEMGKNKSTIASPIYSCSMKRKVFDESPTRGESSKRHAALQNSEIQMHCGGLFSLGSPNIKTRIKGMSTSQDSSGSDDSEWSLEKFEEDIGIITSEKFELREVSPATERAIEAAKMLKPKYPSFMVILRPCNFRSNYVYVPVKFARRYLIRGLESIKVQDSVGREWTIFLVWSPRKLVKLGGGWHALWRENKLKEGNVCVFELIKNDVLKLTLFCANQIMDNCEEEFEIITSEMFELAKPSPESQRAIEAARMLKPKNPSFMVLLRPYNCRDNHLYVPAQFARKHACSVSQSVKLQVSDGKEWALRLLWKKHGCRVLAKRWNIFCSDNKLEGGEVCVFELIDNDVLKVHIFRAVQDVETEN